MKSRLNGIRVAFVFAIIATIFLLVVAIKDLKLVNNLKALYTYTGSTYSMVSKLEGIAISELVFAIFALIFGLIGIGVSFGAKTDTSPFNLLMFTFAIVIVQKIVTIFQGIELQKMVTPYYSADNESIFGLIICFFAVLFILIAMVCKGANQDKAAGVLGIISSLLFIIVLIIALADIGEAEALPIIYVVMLMLSCIVILVASGIVVYDASQKHASGESNAAETEEVTPEITSVTKVEEPQPAPEVVKKPEPKPASKPQTDELDPIESLRKLKNLLDEGVITKEEYEDKRKKYVDKL